MPTEEPEENEEPEEPIEKPKKEVRVSLPESEEEPSEPKPVSRHRSNRPHAHGNDEPKRHHHHHHKSPEAGESKHHRKHRPSTRSEEPPQDDEAILGDFGKEAEAISEGSEESDKEVPSYNFTAPISRISRSPTPIRRTVAAPARRFTPSRQIRPMDDSDDDETYLGRSSVFGTRTFTSPGRMAASSDTRSPTP